MTPDEMAERLAEWAADVDSPSWWERRVDCVEPEGPRRTWALWEGGRQVGLVRMRSVIDIAVRDFAGGSKHDGVFSTAGVQVAMAVRGETPWPQHVEALMRHPSITSLKGGCHWRHDGSTFDGLPWTVEASDRTRRLLGLDDAPEPGQTGGEG